MSTQQMAKKRDPVIITHTSYKFRFPPKKFHISSWVSHVHTPKHIDPNNGWAIVFWVWFFNHHKAFGFSWVPCHKASLGVILKLFGFACMAMFLYVWFSSCSGTVLQISFSFLKWKKKWIKWMLKKQGKAKYSKHCDIYSYIYRGRSLMAAA